MLPWSLPVPSVPYARVQRPYVIACPQKSALDGVIDEVTFNSLNSRAIYYAPARSAITDLVLAYPGFTNKLPEQVNGYNYTVTAAIEYPIGTRIAVYTAGNSRTLTVNSSKTMTAFPPVNVTIPAGAQFAVKTYASWSAGHFYLGFRSAATVLNEEWTVRGTGLADETLTATTFTTTATGGEQPSGFAPTVYAKLASPLPVVGVMGDSISVSDQEKVDPVTSMSWWARAMQGKIPVINLARSGDGFNYYWLNPFEGLRNQVRDPMTGAPAITDLIIALGRNDTGTTIAEATNMWTRLQYLSAPFLANGVKVWAATVTPSTTSTDNWATAGNQTLAGLGEAARQEYNNNKLLPLWKSIGLSGVFDVGHIADPTDSGKWAVDGVAGRGAFGYATLTGGAISACVAKTYTNSLNTQGGLYPISTTPACTVYAFPGSGGSGASITANVNGSGNVPTYTINAGGTGYTVPPMIFPPGAYTADGTHPSTRGVFEFIYRLNLGPDTFALG